MPIVDEFECLDQEGNRRTVVVHAKMLTYNTVSDGALKGLGARSYYTEKGEDLATDDGETFQVVLTGKLLRRIR